MLYNVIYNIFKYICIIILYVYKLETYSNLKEKEYNY